MTGPSDGGSSPAHSPGLARGSGCFLFTWGQQMRRRALGSWFLLIVKVRWSLFAIWGLSFKRSVTAKWQRRLQACAKCRATRWAWLPQALQRCPLGDSCAKAQVQRPSVLPRKEEEEQRNRCCSQQQIRQVLGTKDPGWVSSTSHGDGWPRFFGRNHCPMTDG